VGDASLRDDHVVSRWQREERHHFPGHWVIGYIQRFLGSRRKSEQPKKQPEKQINK
jgi:hypothetical protein